MCQPTRRRDDVRMTTGSAGALPPAVANGPVTGETETTSAALGSGRDAGQLVPAPWLGIGLIALGAVVIELAVAARYGYVRDELYFLAAGQHLAFGYVDQPPITPLLARLGAIIGGNTVIGLRLIPALIMGAIVVLTAAMSRRLGACRAGQLLAALASATCAEYLGAAHELTTTTPDFLFWAVTLYLIVRLLESRDPRWWLAIGLCVGVASEAKWNIGFLVAALTADFVVTDARLLLRSRYVLAGCALAAALAAPDLIWQAVHGWPALQVFQVLQQQAGHNRVTYWIAQIVFTGFALTPVWVTGLIWTLRDPQARRFRPVAIGCAIVIVAQFVLGGKPYYSGGAYTFLLAAGAVPIGARLAGDAARSRRRMARALLTSAAIALPVALPVLPAKVLHTVPLQKVNYDLGEEIAWPREVALVAAEYRALPAAQRRVTTILTGNYGEAGAIERYGPGDGLPVAYSGGNNFWLWGPPPAAATDAVAINVSPALLRREFARVRLVATYENGLGVSDDEEGVQIYVATGLRSSWAAAWPAFRDYG
jgi:Dolichyl-phosphate-mannose-protein mannosyltransferase